MTVFMDTYSLIAWINTRDAAHPPVKSYLDAYSGSIVTTEWVLLEFADAFALSSAKPFAIEAIKRIHRLPREASGEASGTFRVSGPNQCVVPEAQEVKQWSLISRNWLSGCWRITTPGHRASSLANPST